MAKTLVHQPPREPEAKDSAVSHVQVLMFHHIMNNLTQIGKVKYKNKNLNHPQCNRVERNKENHKRYLTFAAHSSQFGREGATKGNTAGIQTSLLFKSN